MYFKNFPKIDYEFSTENGKLTVRMQDVFRRVALTKKTLNTSTNFMNYVVNDGDTPDQVAFDVYGDSALWWIILLSNGVVDLNDDWVKSSNEINKLFSEFLDGKSYYFMHDLDIKSGDIIVKRDVDQPASIDVNIWGVVDKSYPYFHNIDVTSKKSKGEFNNDDEFYVYSRDGEDWSKVHGFGLTACAVQSIGGTACAQILGPTAGYNNGDRGVVPNGPHCATQGSTFGIIRKSESIKDGLSFFEYHNKDMLNPYSMFDGNSPNGTTGDFYRGDGSLCGLTATLLYKWITDDMPVNSGIEVVSKGVDIIRKNDEKRMIKLLTPETMSLVVGEFNSLINNTVPPGTTKYITIL